MNKSWFTGLISLFMMVGALPISALATNNPYESYLVKENDQIWRCYNLDDGTIKVSGYAGNDTEAEIPETLAGKRVTVVGWKFDRGTLTSLTIPSSVKEIEACAFEESGLTYVVLPEGLTKIHEDTFRDCSITSIIIPDSVTQIEKNAFAGCKDLAAVKLPNKLAVLEDGTFYDCKSLKEITIPESVKTIESDAFDDCSSLLSIQLPAHVESVGETDAPCFSGCTSLEKFEVAQDNAKYTAVDGVLFNKDLTRLVRFPEGKRIDQYEIPKGVKTIWECAFYECGGVKKISIPKSVEYIGYSAFLGCRKLKSITIPKNVTQIDEMAFYDCPKLKTIKVDKKNTKYSAKSGVLMNKKQTRLLRCPEAKRGYYIVPSSVTTIEDRAFVACVNLQGIEIRKNVTEMGGNDFSYYDEVGDHHYLSNLVLERGSYAATYAKEFQMDYTSTIKIKSLKAKTGGFTVKWSKFKYAQGYEIRYATNPEMKNAVKIKVSADKKSKSVKKLTAGQKYYVQVRPYLTDTATEKTVYSVWSKQKSVSAG